MLELIQITNDIALARRCDALPGLRLMVDLERLGKAERQAGRGSFISAHEPADIDRIRAVLTRAPLMVRLDPLHEGTADQIDDAIARGAQRLMLPMFREVGEIARFCELVAGRVPVTALLETREALACVDAWVATPGMDEVYVGLNDLHLSLGLRFMFEPLALGLVDRVAAVSRAAGRRFGFGGIARLDEGLLPGRDVLAEHLRLGSGAVILSRTFHRAGDGDFEAQVAALRAAEGGLSARDAAAAEADRLRVGQAIRDIADRIGAAETVPAA